MRTLNLWHLPLTPSSSSKRVQYYEKHNDDCSAASHLCKNIPWGNKASVNVYQMPRSSGSKTSNLSHEVSILNHSPPPVNDNILTSNPRSNKYPLHNRSRILRRPPHPRLPIRLHPRAPTPNPHTLHHHPIARSPSTPPNPTGMARTPRLPHRTTITPQSAQNTAARIRAHPRKSTYPPQPPPPSPVTALRGPAATHRLHGGNKSRNPNDNDLSHRTHQRSAASYTAALNILIVFQNPCTAADARTHHETIAFRRSTNHRLRPLLHDPHKLTTRHTLAQADESVLRTRRRRSLRRRRFRRDSGGGVECQ